MRTFIQKPKPTQKSNSFNNTKKSDRPFFTRNSAVASMLHLQRTIGNSAVLRMLQSQMPERDSDSLRSNTDASPLDYDSTKIPVNHTNETVQTKLSISKPGDKYEQEADRLADQVMRMRQPFDSSHRDSEPVTKDSIDTSASHSSVDGKALDPENRQFFESCFNRDFTDVRVHADSKANESARGFHARAYTIGSNIIFGSREYQPFTTEGRHLLAHELSHVVQQRSISTPGSLIVQREETITADPEEIIIPDETITADPADPGRTKRDFKMIEGLIKGYIRDTLLSLSVQYQNAMNAFAIWYDKRDEKADASFFNSVVNIIMNTTWAWGSPAVGAVAAPLGSVIMLIMDEAAKSIQKSRDKSARSLIASAIIFKTKIQQELKNNRFLNTLKERNQPLWIKIQNQAYAGEQWEPLLHEKAGLPPLGGTDYQIKLLSSLIFEYKKWEMSQRLSMYQGV